MDVETGEIEARREHQRGLPKPRDEIQQAVTSPQCSAVSRGNGYPDCSYRCLPFEVVDENCIASGGPDQDLNCVTAGSRFRIGGSEGDPVPAGSD